MRNCSEDVRSPHTRARSCAPGPDDSRVGSAAHAYIERVTCVSRGLPRTFSGSRASNTRGQAPLCPHRRPPRPKHPIVGVCRRGGLHFGHHAASNRDLTTPNRDLAASKRGNCAVRGARLSLAHVEGATKRGGNCTNRATTRRQDASNGAKPPLSARHTPRRGGRRVGEHGRTSRHGPSHSTRGRRPDNPQTNFARNFPSVTFRDRPKTLQFQRC